MKIKNLIKKLDLQEIQPSINKEECVKKCYTSDLLSDVMANAKDCDILITIQSHKNTIALAVLLDIKLIIICNSRPIDKEMTKLALEHKIGILRTKRNQFEISGELYNLLYLNEQK